MHKLSKAALAVAVALGVSACSDQDSKQNNSQQAAVQSEAAPAAEMADPSTVAPAMEANEGVNNPFFVTSSLYLQYPPFDRIENEHFLPAFERGMQDHLAEIEAIASNPEPASFDNTLVEMERSGQLLNRVSRVFFALVSADTNPDIEAARAELAPQLAAHSDAILLNPQLFQRVAGIYEQREQLGLDAESLRLVEETYKEFIRAGAGLSEGEKEQLKAINAELATLQTKFAQNVQAEVNARAIVVDSAEELAGLSDGEIAAAAEAAKSRGLEGKYVLPLLNTSGQPSLGALENRALRERIHTTSLGRGSSGGEYDNREILTRVVQLRAERARLLGYENHAAYSLENQTAGTVAAVNERLSSLAPRAVANARSEAADLQEMINSEGGDFELASWDWDFYADKVRAERFNFDAAQLKPYFELDNVLKNGVFFAANKVFGLTFEQRTDLPVYHPDVRVWEVFEEDGSTLGLFIEDMYARESKRGGAWMNAYVPQSGLMGTQPVVANHLNVPKPPAGEPTLLTWDEVTTLFHEFGHALHGLFSAVRYPSFSGTSVPRDFVEYPSQVNEMWADWPEVLANYAVHYQTGEPLPLELLDKVLAASQFNEGFRTTEYLAASLLDQAWHQLSPDQVPSAEELLAFEASALENAGIAFAPVPPRYRSTYFSHIIGGYSAGYYSYIWSEVLDADSVEWFKENGGMLRDNGEHFRATLLSQGGSKDAMQLFEDFRGRAPDIQPLLERRGLTAE
jgi:peptidyl-dipeptidase Dcp